MIERWHSFKQSFLGRMKLAYPAAAAPPSGTSAEYTPSMMPLLGSGGPGGMDIMKLPWPPPPTAMPPPGALLFGTDGTVAKSPGLGCACTQ